MSRRILLTWGLIWLFLWLAAGLYLGPRIQTITAQEKSAHNHALNLSLLVLIMGLVQPFLGLSEGLKNILAVVLCFGTFLLPVGVLIELANNVTGGVLATIGGILVVFSVLVYLIGIIKYQTQESD